MGEDEWVPPTNSEIVRERLGEAIREERVRLGLSRAQLAKRLGYSPQRIWTIEAGLSDPKISTLLHIAEALDSSLSDLVSRTEPGTPPARPSLVDPVPKVLVGVLAHIALQGTIP